MCVGRDWRRAGAACTALGIAVGLVLGVAAAVVYVIMARVLR